MKNLSSRHLGIIVIGLLLLGIWVITRNPEGKQHKATAPKNSSDKLAEARVQIESAMRDVVMGDSEGQKLFDSFMAKGSVGLFIGQNFRTEKSASPELVQNVPLDQRRFLIIPIMPSERLVRGLVSPANFFFDAKSNMVLTPALKTFTKLWFGARAIHEVSHVYDYLQGIEPAPSNEYTEDFVRGEIKAHKLEIRTLNLRTSGQLVQKIRSVAVKLGKPPGFPEKEVTQESIDFNEIDQLFPKPLSQEEDNTRKGSYLIAVNFAMAEITGLGEKGILTFMTEYFKRREREDTF